VGVSPRDGLALVALPMRSARGRATLGYMPQRSRPVIGITSYAEDASWATWQDVPVALLPYAYVEAVSASGGLPVIIPPEDCGPAILGILDGLVLAGGPDIDPARYGAPAHPRTHGQRPGRDAGELALLQAALDSELPVLGICRGMQLMAVAAGGRLIQHMPDKVGHDAHRPTAGVYGEHGATFAAGSRVAGVLGRYLEVNSYHHQGVADPGWLTPTGWADDRTIEVLEDPSRRFAVGVQWHPEATGDHRLFAALVEAAREIARFGESHRHSA
jgi:putative glutamine amidotransferase